MEQAKFIAGETEAEKEKNGLSGVLKHSLRDWHLHAADEAQAAVTVPLLI